MKKFFSNVILVLGILGTLGSFPAHTQAADTFYCDYLFVSSADFNLLWEGAEYNCVVDGFPVRNVGGKNVISPPNNCYKLPGITAYVKCFGPPAGYACRLNHEGVPSIFPNLRCDSARVTPPTEAPPTTPAPPINYTPLEPLPGVYTQGEVKFSSLINGLFRILLVLGALFAVATLVLGGVMYMVSDVVETKSTAKKRIIAAVFGLLVLACSWLILNTINPQLVVLIDAEDLPSTAPNIGTGGVFDPVSRPKFQSLSWNGTLVTAVKNELGCTTVCIFTNPYLLVRGDDASYHHSDTQAAINNYSAQCRSMYQGAQPEAVDASLAGYPGDIMFVCRKPE